MCHSIQGDVAKRLEAEAVPEPSAILGILAATGMSYAMKRRSRGEGKSKGKVLPFCLEERF
jgi:hypothetical protein